MLYLIARWIAQLTLKSYFRKIAITGQGNTLVDGPVIFVANHPSAFMDPMVVACTVKRNLHFLAAAEFFGKGLKAWFYQNFLNMIPVYRPNTLPGESYKNEGVFTKVIELLAKGKSILVFPEGNSVTEKRIRKLKTGVARMALNTKESSKVNVKIIPVGLNYSNPHRFRSDLYVNIGDAISTEQFSSNKEDVVRLTDQVEQSLKDTVLHIKKEELDSIVEKIDVVLKWGLSGDRDQVPNEFRNRQRLIDSIEELSNKSPDSLRDVESKLEVYLKKIQALDISDGSIAKVSVLINIGDLLRLILTLPLFLAGFAMNYLPYYATVQYFRNLNRYSRDGFEAPKGINQAFKGSVAMGLGMGMFIIYYLALASTIAWYLGNFWIGVVCLPLFYLLGLFCMRYIRWFYLLNQKRKLRTLLRNQREVFTSLIAERQDIIKQLMSMIG